MPPTTILWFRNDLRLADHPALEAALQPRGPIVPVFVAPLASADRWAPGAASNWWLHHSLKRLDQALRGRGSRLVLRSGDPSRELVALARETGASHVLCSRRSEPGERAAEDAVREALALNGVALESFQSGLLFEPGTIATAEGQPYRVFTPFWRACLAKGLPAAGADEPETIPCPKSWPGSLALDDLELMPRTRWDAGLHEAWEPGRQGAMQALEAFLGGPLDTYAEERNRPDLPGTSRLSPHLHFGEIGVREVVAACSERDAQVFLSEIGWREFAHHLLWHFPNTPEVPLRHEFARFPWRDDDAAFQAWRKGQTGFPFVDAAMRELWSTGWMHNRARMVVASFLVKDLLIPWQRGAEWFWDTLVDADLANNTLGWQWTAGCGADAAPYFRVFNPTTQGEKFDPSGAYVRRWVPELAPMPDTWIHRPHEAPEEVLRGAAVQLGQTYPLPIVDHPQARRDALAAYEDIRRSTGAG
ncbi:MAG: deoxyribodipyrimidine photo-lyase [Chthonomonadaceae bacterium]|nr:deoxyribodipyrimidine photo-lyase [Chthonomonadaceae bacterium]